MSEGGLLPWKRHTGENEPEYANYKDLQKPLPPPPPGQTWLQDENGEYRLTSFEVLARAAPVGPDDPGEASTLQSAEVVVQLGATEAEIEALDEDLDDTPEGFMSHVVLPGDTLIGICLRYRVKAQELRRINNFHGDFFRLCKTLLIPINAKNQEISKALTHEQKKQIFVNVSRLGSKEAEYYLSQSEWRLKKALSVWREDALWEAEMQRNNRMARSQAQDSSNTSTRHRRPAGPGCGHSTATTGGSDSAPYRVNELHSTSDVAPGAFTVTEEGDIELTSARGEARAPLLGQPVSYV
eukprot:CAMPEP_0113935320 /NCGR_PEP_ID=MMETSP1339-20121228/2478_1 /TAXON_ID=94617 /ORGANISM="Fibrocapsa japonica" /LENGTH=296 /DNA_ID=CAMNT_0000937417 /DNA_START=81 /DNA_END=971 /DNA_ORIENTATION=+ /assembly_acc=CAM_ASM_000762